MTKVDELANFQKIQNPTDSGISYNEELQNTNSNEETNSLIGTLTLSPTSLQTKETHKTTSTNTSGFRSNSIYGLFDIGMDLPKASLDELMQNHKTIPLFILQIIMFARNEQVTTMTLVEAVQSQQKRQQAVTQEIITQMKSMQAKNEKLAQTEWKALVGTDRTGAARKDDPSNGCWKIVAAIGMAALIAITIVVGCIAGGVVGGVVAAAALVAAYLIISMISMIVNACISDPAKKHKVNKILDWFNPAAVFADAIVTIVCEFGNYKETDESMRKLRMWLKLAIDLTIAMVIIVASIAITAASGGAAAPATALIIATAISGLIAGGAAIANGIVEITRGTQNLELAKQRLILNRMAAMIEKVRADLEIIQQNISMLLDMFSNTMEIVRDEYEKASQVIKEYRDAKQVIAQNFKA